MKNLGVRKPDNAEINMTPMLDIVFIMLIFFIVASSFVQESGLDVTQKQGDENQMKDQANNRAIYVRICSDDSIFVDQRSIDLRSVRANVEAKLAANSETLVILETREEASTGSLVAVMDQAIAAHASVSISSQSAQCAADT